MDKRQYFVGVECVTTGERLHLGIHHGPLAPLLEGRLRRWAAKRDALPNPRFRADIQCMNTEQRIYSGLCKGSLVPVLQGEMMERALIIDAGKRLSAEQRNGAYHGNS